MRRARALLLLVVLALAATGCYRSDLAIEVNDDGSGTYTQVVAINTQAFADMAEQFGSAGAETGMPEDPCEEIQTSADQEQSQLPSGTSVEPYRDGDFCGVMFSAEFDDVAELEQIFGEVSSETESQGLGSLTSFTIERDGDGWFFEATPSASADSAGGGAGEMGMFSEFMEGASNIVRLKLPGTQVDHNADRIADDGTLIWNLDPLGDSRTLTARTEPGDPITGEVVTEAGEEVGGEIGAPAGGGDDGGSSVIWVVIGAIVVVAAIVGFVLWQRKRGSKSTAAPTAAGVGAAGTAGAAPGGFGDPHGAPATPPTDPAAGAGVAPPESSADAAGSSGGPQWDPQRNAYIQWDAAGNRWLQYDDATKEWKPIA